ncbi:MAG TPA: SMI1/KNR4 family protein [Nitrospiraceae bacterium]|jgi:hypothetical protein|nr:SMI1/KNR4 family protein [Nitrospiraceae bacterium]
MSTDWRAEHQLLANAGIVIARGLTDSELQDAESEIGSAIPADLREFLSQGLPTGEKFPDWRQPRSVALREQLDWPFEGITFDITNNSFWLEEWGPRPDELRDAIATARRFVSAAPRLIPIFAHRYIPAEPCVSGNPIFSVYQPDIIYYGVDLANYLRCEFRPSAVDNAAWHEPREIRFWSSLAG